MAYSKLGVADHSEYPWKKVGIIEIDGAIHVVVCHYVNGNISGTSHRSLAEAKTQARKDFGIEEGEWIETSDETVDKMALLTQLITIHPIRIKNNMSAMTLQGEHYDLIADKFFKEIVEDRTPRGDFEIGDAIYKTGKMSFGNWKSPVGTVPDSHRKILQPILDDPNRKKAWYDLAEMYMVQDEDFRLTVSKYWDFGVDWGWRLPISSVGKPVTILTRVHANLIYYSIAVRHSQDIRDDLVGIATTYHLCASNGYEVDEVFRSIAKVSLPIIGRLLINFVERDPGTRSLKVFHLVQVPQPDGTIEIERNW